MTSLALSAVVLGGLANLALALIHLAAMRSLKPVPPTAANLGYIRATNVRYVYLYALFAALSFAFARPLVMTGLGIAVSAGICGLLLIQTVIFFLNPELRGKTNRRTVFTVIGAVCYAYSVYVGLVL
jgi:hypothetical protein